MSTSSFHADRLSSAPLSRSSPLRPGRRTAIIRFHLVSSQDPAYIPADFDAWPIYYKCIVDALDPFPDAHDAAVVAVKAKMQELKGLENRDIPPNSRP